MLNVVCGQPALFCVKRNTYRTYRNNYKVISKWLFSSQMFTHAAGQTWPFIVDPGSLNAQFKDWIKTGSTLWKRHFSSSKLILKCGWGFDPLLAVILINNFACCIYIARPANSLASSTFCRKGWWCKAVSWSSYI